MQTDDQQRKLLELAAQRLLQAAHSRKVASSSCECGVQWWVPSRRACGTSGMVIVPRCLPRLTPPVCRHGVLPALPG